MGKPKENRHAFLRIKSGFMKAARAFAGALFPESYVCIDCGRDIPSSCRRHSLCSACAAKLPYRTGKTCAECGDYNDEGRLCKRCMAASPVFDKVLAPFEYSGVVRKMIIGYKDGGQTYLYTHIARHLIDYWTAAEDKADLLAYVPSDKRAIKRRGFEHNKKVCELFAATTGFSLIYPLERTVKAEDQTTNNREERALNVKNNFVIKEGFDVGIIKDKTILLVDDVVTTGATAGECARVLKDNGASKVLVLALARR